MKPSFFSIPAVLPLIEEADAVAGVGAVVAGWLREAQAVAAAASSRRIAAETLVIVIAFGDGRLSHLHRLAARSGEVVEVMEA